MTFNEYWNQYGELHAASCGGSIRLFAKEIWKSAMSDAIPRAQVQAAVDNLVESSSYLRDCECPDCDAIRAMCRELGITPTERE